MSKPSMTHPGSPKGYSLSDAQIVAAFDEWARQYAENPEAFDASGGGASYGARAFATLLSCCPTAMVDSR